MEVENYNQPTPTTRNHLSIRKILIVDDDPVWRMLIERAVRKIDSGVKVYFSDNANQALTTIQTVEDFDFIIADHSLDGAKTGLDLWDILIKQKSEIPYVLISGTKRANFFEQLMPYRSEMVPIFVEKPASAGALAERLSEALMLHLTPREASFRNLKRKYFWNAA